MSPESKIHNKSLSVFLNLENLQVLIVGGGTEALQSLKLLIESFPKTEINLISETVSEEIKNFADGHENTRIHERRFFEDDFYNAHIAIITDFGVDFYTEIIDIVQKKNVLISIENQPELSDFQLESFISKTYSSQQDEQKLKWQYSKDAKKYRRLVIYLSLAFAAFFLGIAFDQYFFLFGSKRFCLRDSQRILLDAWHWLFCANGGRRLRNGLRLNKFYTDVGNGSEATLHIRLYSYR